MHSDRCVVHDECRNSVVALVASKNRTVYQNGLLLKLSPGDSTSERRCRSPLVRETCNEYGDSEFCNLAAKPLTGSTVVGFRQRKYVGPNNPRPSNILLPQNP